MKTLKQFIVDLEEAKYPEQTPMREVTMAELIQLLSKGQMNSLKKNKAIDAIRGMDQKYFYEVMYSGFVKIHIEAGYAMSGVMKPTRMLEIILDPRKVIGVERFFRGLDDTTWKHLG